MVLNYLSYVVTYHESESSHYDYKECCIPRNQCYDPYWCYRKEESCFFDDCCDDDRKISRPQFDCPPVFCDFSEDCESEKKCDKVIYKMDCKPEPKHEKRSPCDFPLNPCIARIEIILRNFSIYLAREIQNTANTLIKELDMGLENIIEKEKNAIENGLFKANSTIDKFIASAIKLLNSEIAKILCLQASSLENTVNNIIKAAENEVSVLVKNLATETDANIENFVKDFKNGLLPTLLKITDKASAEIIVATNKSRDQAEKAVLAAIKRVRDLIKKEIEKVFNEVEKAIVENANIAETEAKKGLAIAVESTVRELLRNVESEIQRITIVIILTLNQLCEGAGILTRGGIQQPFPFIPGVTGLPGGLTA